MKTGPTTLIFNSAVKGLRRLSRMGSMRWVTPLLVVGLWPFPGLVARAELHYIDAIVPAPRAVDYGQWFVFGERSGSPAHVRIHLGRAPRPLDRAAADAIRERIVQLGLPRVTVDLSQSGLEDGSRGREAHLEIILGTDGYFDGLADAYDALGLEPLKRAEAYRIRTTRNPKGHPRFLLKGSDPRGTFYAAQSLVQMLTVRDGRLAVRSLQVDDWPAFQSRASGNDERPPAPEVAAAAVDWFTRFKMNAWPLGQSYHWPKNWRQTPESTLQTLRTAARQPASEALNLRYQIHPFGRSHDPEQRTTVRVSSLSDRAVFIDAIRDAIAAGASEILVRADDFHELSGPDKRVFASKAEAHTTLVKAAYEAARETSPEIRFYFCPAYYTGQWAEDSTESRRYLREIGRRLPESIPVLWTGPEVISDSFTAGEQRAFSQLVGRPVYLWDNTVFQERSDFGYRYAYSFYMLHPMDTQHPPELSGLAPGVRFNFGYDDSWINRIGNVVLADYLWNPEAFEPDHSLRRAVGLCVGARAVTPFLQAAADIRRVYDLKHSPARWATRSVPSNERFRERISELEASSLNTEAIRELEQRWNNLSAAVDQLNDLEAYFDSLRSRALTVLDPGVSADWRVESSGDWTASGGDNLAMFHFPYETEAEPGSFISLNRSINIPASESNRYFLHFVFDDAYRVEGTPPAAYPGYFHKQVLIDGDVVWEDDAVGEEPILPITIEVSRQLRGQYSAELTIRCIDKKGVSNLGLKASVSPIFLTAR